MTNTVLIMICNNIVLIISIVLLSLHNIETEKMYSIYYFSMYLSIYFWSLLENLKYNLNP